MWRWKTSARSFRVPHARPSVAATSRTSSSSGALCSSSTPLSTNHKASYLAIRPSSIDYLLRRAFSADANDSNNQRNSGSSSIASDPNTTPTDWNIPPSSANAHDNWNDTLPPPRLEDSIKVPKRVDRARVPKPAENPTIESSNSANDTWDSSWDDSLPPPRLEDVIKVPRGADRPRSPKKLAAKSDISASSPFTSKRDEITARAQGDDDWNETPKATASGDASVHVLQKFNANRDANSDSNFGGRRSFAKSRPPLASTELREKLYDAGLIAKAIYASSTHSPHLLLMHRLAQLHGDMQTTLPNWRESGSIPDAKTQFTEEQRKFADAVISTLARFLDMQRESVGLAPFISEKKLDTPTRSSSTPVAPNNVTPTLATPPTARSKYNSILDLEESPAKPTTTIPTIPTKPWGQTDATVKVDIPAFILISPHYSVFLRLLRSIPPPLLPLSIVNNLWTHMVSQRTSPPKWSSVTPLPFLPLQISIRSVNIVLDLYASLGAWEQMWSIWLWVQSQSRDPLLQPTMITINTMFSGLLRQMDAKMRAQQHAERHPASSAANQGQQLFEFSSRGFFIPALADRARFERVWQVWKKICTQAPTTLAPEVHVVDEEDDGAVWGKEEINLKDEEDSAKDEDLLLPSQITNALNASDRTLPPFFEPLRKYFRGSVQQIVEQMLPEVPTVASMGDKRFHANLLKYHNSNMNSFRAAYWACVVMHEAKLDLGKGPGAMSAMASSTLSDFTSSSTNGKAVDDVDAPQDLSIFRQVYTTFHRELMQDTEVVGIGKYLSPRGKSEFEIQLWKFFTQTIGLKPDTHLVSLRMKLMVALGNFKLAKHFAEQHASRFSEVPSESIDDYSEIDCPSVADGKARSLFFENYLKVLSSLEVVDIVAGYRPSFHALKTPLHAKSQEIMRSKSCPLPLELLVNKNSSSIVNMQHLLNCYIREKILLPLSIPFHLQATLPFTRERFYTCLLEVYLKGAEAHAKGVPLPSSLAYAQTSDKTGEHHKGVTQMSQIEHMEFWSLYSRLYERTLAQQITDRSQKGKTHDRSKYYVRLETFVLLLDRLPFVFAAPEVHASPTTTETSSTSSSNTVPMISPAAQATTVQLLQLIMSQAEKMYRPLIENNAKHNSAVELPWRDFHEPVSVLFTARISFVRVVNSYLAVLTRLPKNAQALELAETSFQYWFRDTVVTPFVGGAAATSTPVPRLHPLPHTLRSLLTIYISGEKLHTISELLHSMREQFNFEVGVDLYEAAILGLEGLCTDVRRSDNRLTNARNAFHLYEEMLKKNFAPSAAVYTSLMAICDACDSVPATKKAGSKAGSLALPTEGNDSIVKGKPNWKLSEELLAEMQKVSEVVKMLKHERRHSKKSDEVLPIEISKEFAVDIQFFIPQFALYSRAGLRALENALTNGDEDERSEILMESATDSTKPLFFLNKSIKLLQHLHQSSKKTYGFVHMKIAEHPIIFQYIFQLWSRLSVEYLQLAAIDLPSKTLQSPLASAIGAANVPGVSQLSSSTPVLPALFSVIQLFEPTSENTVMWNEQWEKLMKFAIMYEKSLEALRSRASPSGDGVTSGGSGTKNFTADIAALDELISQGQSCMTAGWKQITSRPNLNASMYAFQIANLAFAPPPTTNTVAIADSTSTSTSTSTPATTATTAPVDTLKQVWDVFHSSQTLGVYPTPELIHSIMVAMAHLREYSNLFLLYRNLHVARHLRIPITVHHAMMDWILQWAQQQSPAVEAPATVGEGTNQIALCAKDAVKAAETFLTTPTFQSPFHAGRVLFLRRATKLSKKDNAAVDESEQEEKNAQASTPVTVLDYWQLYQLLLLEEKTISTAATSSHIHSADVLLWMETYFFEHGLLPHSRTQPHFFNLKPIVDGVRMSIERSVQQLAQDASVNTPASEALTFLQADLRKLSPDSVADLRASSLTAPNLFEALTSGSLVNDLLANHIDAALSLWIVWLKARLARFPEKKFKPLHVHFSSIQSTSIELHKFVQTNAEAVLKRHGMSNVELVNLTLAQAHEAFPPLNRKSPSQARAGEYLKIDTKDL